MRANRVANVIQAPSLKDFTQNAMVAAESYNNTDANALKAQAKREQIAKQQSLENYESHL